MCQSQRLYVNNEVISLHLLDWVRHHRRDHVCSVEFSGEHVHSGEFQKPTEPSGDVFLELYRKLKDIQDSGATSWWEMDWFTDLDKGIRIYFISIFHILV